MQKWEMMIDQETAMFVGWRLVDSVTGEVVCEVPGGRPTLDPDGKERPDPTPVQVPAGFKRPESLAEQVQRLVRRYSDEYADQQGVETFEEADDFDIPDDPIDPSTPYETIFDPILSREVTPQEFKERSEHYRALYERAARREGQEQQMEELLATGDASRQEGPTSPSPGNPEAHRADLRDAPAQPDRPAPAGASNQ